MDDLLGLGEETLLLSGMLLTTLVLIPKFVFSGEDPYFLSAFILFSLATETPTTYPLAPVTRIVESFILVHYFRISNHRIMTDFYRARILKLGFTMFLLSKVPSFPRVANLHQVLGIGFEIGLIF